MDEFAPYWRLLGRLHPVVVHFPIALLLTACLFEFFQILRRRPPTVAPDAPSPPSKMASLAGSGGRSGRATPISVAPPSPPVKAPSSTAVGCLLVGVLGAGFAAWFGWLHAAMEPHGAAARETIFWHRWLSIAASGMAFVALWAAWLAQWKRPAWAALTYRIFLFLSAPLVGFAGHLGGTLVYGEGYALAALEEERAARQKRSPAAASAAQTSDAREHAATDSGFPPAIHAIFVARCVECHGPLKSKGSLRLDTLAAALDAEDVVVPGAAVKSELVRRITLPPDDSDFMPRPQKRGDPVQPLKPEEIEALRAWIDKLKLNDKQETSAAPPRGADAARPAESGSAESDSQAATVDKAIQAVLERGGLAVQIAADTDARQVSFSLRGTAITDADLAALQGLEPVLEWLDLSNTAVTDEGLRQLTGFTRLQRLQLQRTKIGDAGLEQLAPLKRLDFLNLYGTSVTDAGLRHLQRLPNLRRLFLWRTPTTDAGVAELQNALPNLVIERGLSLSPAGASVAAPAAAQNPPKPACCAAAAAQGKTCEHPCCVESAARGAVCEKCLEK